MVCSQHFNPFSDQVSQPRGGWQLHLFPTGENVSCIVGLVECKLTGGNVSAKIIEKALCCLKLIPRLHALIMYLGDAIIGLAEWVRKFPLKKENQSEFSVAGNCSGHCANLNHAGWYKVLLQV